jgi:predicted Fe-Mo cluster-binding NifX family protein
MKICIPTMGEKGLDEIVGEHFGRVPTYTIVDSQTNKIKIIPNTSHHAGGVEYPPEILAREGVELMLCRGLGRRAINMFEESGISVFIGATGTVRDAIEAYKQNKLQKATSDNACQQHAFHNGYHSNNESCH